MKRLENGRYKMKILNNKGLPVMQYEPWFSINSDYEFDERLSIYGVTPIMHYDPLGRLIQTDFPDESTTRVEFDVWQQKNFDQNDCDGDSPHYNTPQVLDLDVLGRVFRITDDNGAFGDSCVTHNKLDITGRITQVRDGLKVNSADNVNRICTTNLFAISENHLLKVHNIDSGTRWLLNDTAGKPVRKWDSREHEFQFTYDALQRPVDTIANGICIEKLVYDDYTPEEEGETPPDIPYRIGRVTESYAQDGKTKFEYDFKGNVISKEKQFTEDYANQIDWNTTVNCQLSTVNSITAYDALNRPVTITQPDSTILHYGYDKGGLLNFVQRNDTDVHISNIEYNEKQQRLVVIYGNSTETTYTYHDQNFRLLNIYTQNTANDKVLQNLQYDYDKVGNIIKIEDAAQEVIYENNQEIKAESEYTYDALYRLLSTTGRERAGLGGSYIPGKYEDRPFFYTDPNSVRNYTHHFEYDALGNMLNNNGLINIYDNETNRLLGYNNNSTLFDYDPHGNMISMPGTENMIWNAKDELAEAKNSTETFHSYYRYDAQGNRTRKVTVKGNVREEYYYVDGYELFRKHTNEELSEEYETVNISDDEKVFVRIESRNNTSVIRYQYDNHLGSACLELNDGGDLISYEEYYAFGETAYFVQDSTISVSLKRYKYCGKEKDEETGLYYYGMRYYAAWLCRFVSVDPLQFKYPELTPFQYASNNPVSMIDLDGMEGVKPEDKTEVKKESERQLLTPALYEILNEALNGEKGLIKRDKENNRQEYGGTILSDKEGNLRIIWAKPGGEASENDEKIKINLSIAEDENEQKILNNPGGEGFEVIAFFHSHPSVKKIHQIDLEKLNKIESTELRDSYLWKQHPSEDDIKGAQEINEFVFAMGTEEVFKYDKNTELKNIENPGSIEFDDLKDWNILFNNSKKQFRLKFMQND